jgi:hypothetical protein
MPTARSNTPSNTSGLVEPRPVAARRRWCSEQVETSPIRQPRRWLLSLRIASIERLLKMGSVGWGRDFEGRGLVRQRGLCQPLIYPNIAEPSSVRLAQLRRSRNSRCIVDQDDTTSALSTLLHDVAEDALDRRGSSVVRCRRPWRSRSLGEPLRQ